MSKEFIRIGGVQEHNLKRRRRDIFVVPRDKQSQAP